MWIDTHCHPYFEPYTGREGEIIGPACGAGVKKMIAIGCDSKSNRQALALTENFDGVFAAVGVHPTELHDFTDEELAWMRKTCSREQTKKIVAIGEIGLDYFRNKYTPAEQERVFRAQIALARELDLPCVIHSRDSAEDTLRILLDEKVTRAVFHCYSYDLAFAKRLWDKGYLTSFTGIVTYPNARAVQEVAAAAPEDMFFLETDCPFLPPQSKRGQVNQMSYILEIGEKVAELRGCSATEIARVTTRNAERWFRI
ncbi:MAG: TatD family hydrolase [Candidatus Gracilibacteria bacterium]|jgi:TatD DNase family protein